MSKFESYADRAEKIYLDARRDYTNVQDTFQKAKTTYESNKRPAGAWKADAAQIAKAARAEADYLEAKQKYETDLATLQGNIQKQLAALREELAAAVQKHYTADPAALDPAMLELLKSGILNPAEYKHLAERNRDNITMRRLIAQYAQNAADKIPDSADTRADKMALRAVARDGREDGSGILQAFDLAARTAQKAVQSSRYMADGTAEHWEELGGKALSAMR